MKKLLIVLFCLISVTIVASDGDKAQFFEITDLGSSAKMIGIGNIDGYTPHAAVVFENPAGMYRVDRYSVSLFRTTLMEELQYTSGATVLGLGNLGKLGLGVYIATVDNIYTTAKPNGGDIVTTGTFAYQNAVGKLAYQKSLSDNIHLGAAYSYYNFQASDVLGLGSNIDIGGIFQTDNWDYSIQIKNLVPQDVTYSNGGIEKTARQFVLSTRTGKRRLELFSQGKIVQGKGQFIKSFALNYHALNQYVDIHMGVKEFYNAKGDIKSAFSVGTSLYMGALQLDYTYQNTDYMDNPQTHYLAMSITR